MVFLLLWLFLLTMPVTSLAQFNFTTNNYGTITITGYSGSGGNVIIPDAINGYPVTSIGVDAFYDCSSLVSLTISTNVTSIGEAAFYHSSLSSVIIPNSVTQIGSDAFFNCSMLTSVIISNNVTSIGGVVFGYCSSLTNITVTAGNPVYASVGGVLFDKAIATLIEYPSGATTAAYTITNSVTSIGGLAFWGSHNLASLTIPNSVTNIGSSVFEGCSSLTNVTIPDSVISIGDDAFSGSSLRNVTIPDSVTSVGNGTFSGCSSLTNISVNAGNPDYASVGGVLFDKAIATLVGYPNGLTNQVYTISNSVTRIGADAFVASDNLTNVIIPDSVTDIGDSAFEFCINLQSVTIPSRVTNIESSAFEQCRNLSSVTILDGVSRIGDDTFALCPSLTSVTIPSSVTNIGFYAFEECSGLTNVFFLGNAPSVGGITGWADTSVFSGESGTVYYFSGTSGWSSTFGDWSTALWYQSQPRILGNDQGLGVKSNGFNFTISWGPDTPIVIQACTNMSNPVWMPLATNLLVNGTNHFSDSQWTNFPNRFYRIRLP